MATMLTEKYQVQRAPRDEETEATSRIEVQDLRGDTLLSMTPAQFFALMNRLAEVAVELASEQTTVEGMMSVPAVTAVDLAGAFEMGRQAGERAVPGLAQGPAAISGGDAHPGRGSAGSAGQ